MTTTGASFIPSGDIPRDVFIDVFIYTGQESGDIPRDVTHVKVHPSVKVIKGSAFIHCSQLMNVELCEGLEKIGNRAFYSCTSLCRIVIPKTVKVIGVEAFKSCSQLTNVELCEGLEKIGEQAFSNCISLQGIMIPSTVEVIDEWAFSGVRNVKFCKEIEEFVSGESLRVWWNRCEWISGMELSAYGFFCQSQYSSARGCFTSNKMAGQHSWHAQGHSFLLPQWFEGLF